MTRFASIHFINGGAEQRSVFTAGIIWQEQQKLTGTEEWKRGRKTNGFVCHTPQSKAGEDVSRLQPVALLYLRFTLGFICYPIRRWPRAGIWNVFSWSYRHARWRICSRWITRFNCFHIKSIQRTGFRFAKLWGYETIIRKTTHREFASK